jgi:hypothetical protein
MIFYLFSLIHNWINCEHNFFRINSYVSRNCRNHNDRDYRACLWNYVSKIRSQSMDDYYFARNGRHDGIPPFILFSVMLAMNFYVGFTVKNGLEFFSRNSFLSSFFSPEQK